MAQSPDDEPLAGPRLMTRQAIMAIGAHADDIELCAGGTLIRGMDLGYDIIYVMATNNMSGNWNHLESDGRIRYTRPPAAILQPQRKREAQAAAAFFGTQAIHLDHPQRHYFDEQGRAVEMGYGSPAPAGVDVAAWPGILTAYEHQPSVRRLADIILAHHPEVIFTHGLGMVNIEHVATSLLVTQAYWQAVGDGYAGFLLHWHDITQGRFGQAYAQWDVFVDVSDEQQRKFEAVGLHASQIPATDRIKLPDWGSACRCAHAEVFNLISPHPAADLLGRTSFTAQVIQPALPRELTPAFE